MVRTLRNCATISAGLLRGLDRVTATRLSFFLSIPALLAAGLFELKDVQGISAGQTVVGTAIAFVVDGERSPAIPEDEERLTREDITSTVHYLKFRFTPEQQAAFASDGGIVELVVDHPEYRAVVELTAEQRRELATDFTD